MPMRVGNIVTVVLGCDFENLQGEVVEIVDDGDEDGPIGVRFGREYEYLFGILWETDNIIRFLETDLRVETEWRIDVLAKRIYGSHFHHWYEPSNPFSPESDCMIAGCSHKAVMRGVCNIWGTVYPIDFCEDHKKEYHGLVGECLPKLKSKKEEVVAT